MTNKGRLTFFCGKMGAGKSTLARRLADQSNSLLLSEDQWLAALYPDSIHSLNDYVRLSRRFEIGLAVSGCQPLANGSECGDGLSR